MSTSEAESAPAAPGVAPRAVPWRSGAATGVGSLPGTDPDEAMRMVVGELGDFPHLAELPAAGLGSDLVGRGLAHLADLHVEVAVSAWRFADRAGADERRARSALTRDLDVFEEHLQGYAGPLKIQCAGPLTLASSVELHYGDKALADPGAVRDLADSLAEGLAAVTREVARRVPGAEVVVQLDEPALRAVLEGSVPTASGFGTLRAMEGPDAVERLAAVIAATAAAGATPIVHCCAAAPPVGVMVKAGARAVGIDATLLTEADDEAIGEAVEGGTRLFLGLVPSLDTDPAPRLDVLAKPALRLWSRLGFAPERLGDVGVVTPTCGLAGASPGWARRAYRLCVEVGQLLAEDPEGKA